MAGRFGKPHSVHASDRLDQTRDAGLGEWWAAIAAVALAAFAIVALSGSSGSSIAEPIDPTGPILAALAPAERSISSVEDAFARLCRDPVLLALELEPDCENGVITLAESLFDGPGSAQLSAEAEQDVSAAMGTYLTTLRRMPAIWDSLEAIEIRGHSDPTAVRDPYATNLVGSQQRPLGVMLFLTGEGALSEADRRDLERLAIVSAASYSRPPAACPEETRKCYPEWRRVEIRPVLSESLRRGDWSRTLEEVRTTTLRIQQEISTPRP